MKISYDNVNKTYLYPLSKQEIGTLKRFIPPEIVDKIKLIRFGCNTKTTQEGRTIKRGGRYEIRVNFCLFELHSLMLSDKKFGGKVDIEKRIIKWSLPDAKRYASYIQKKSGVIILVCS